MFDETNVLEYIKNSHCIEKNLKQNLIEHFHSFSHHQIQLLVTYFNQQKHEILQILRSLKNQKICSFAEIKTQLEKVIRHIITEQEEKERIIDKQVLESVLDTLQ